jgi:hypothetical protein
MAKKKKKKATTKSKMKRTNKKTSNIMCYAPFQLQPGCSHNIKPCGKPSGGGGGNPPTISGGF